MDRFCSRTERRNEYTAGLCHVLKEQKHYQKFLFKSIYPCGSPRFALSLIFVCLVCTDLIHFSAQERFLFHPNVQSTTLNGAGIFNFLISFVATFINLIDTLKIKKKKKSCRGKKILESYQTRH